VKPTLKVLLTTAYRVNFISIWRLVTVVEHKAATYPTHDPTWWGPITIILANLEVQIACICASVPIFWPVLESRFGSPIIVQREVVIEREERWPAAPRGDSEAELGKLGNLGFPEPAVMGHQRETYKDEYVLSQIDPLRKERMLVLASVRSTSQVRSGSRRGGKRSWWRI
jgi:hypothetical protein